MQGNVAHCEVLPILHSMIPQTFKKSFKRVTAFKSRDFF
jgi:hypothetical protein